MTADVDIFHPSAEHRLLRQTLREFVKERVEPQALEHDRQERFNLALFRELGALGLLGITVPEQYGGTGMDAVAAVIAHEELSASDPGFCLAYLAHACSWSIISVAMPLTLSDSGIYRPSSRANGSEACV